MPFGELRGPGAYPRRFIDHYLAFADVMRNDNQLLDVDGTSDSGNGFSSDSTTTGDAYTDSGADTDDRGSLPGAGSDPDCLAPVPAGGLSPGPCPAGPPFRTACFIRPG